MRVPVALGIAQSVGQCLMLVLSTTALLTKGDATFRIFEAR